MRVLSPRCCAILHDVAETRPWVSRIRFNFSVNKSCFGLPAVFIGNFSPNFSLLEK